MLRLKHFIAMAFAAGAVGLATSVQAASPRAQAFSDEGIGSFITNSMLTSWVIAAILVLIIRMALKTPTLVPHHGQAVVEAIVEGVKSLITPIVGKKMVVVTFPLLSALFIFILIQNWSGMIPFVGTVGWGYQTESGFYVVRELVRPGNADLNMTLALAITSMVAWFYFIFRYAGPRLVYYDIFGNKAVKSEVPLFIYYPLFGVFFAVGLIEIISIIFRPVSLSFRLFGNVYGGETLLHSMMHLFPWGLPVPFYFLEIVIGFVQALVFTLLVSVYIGLICNHEPEPGAAGHH